jgi:hypothetical protein
MEIFSIYLNFNINVKKELNSYLNKNLIKIYLRKFKIN